MRMDELARVSDACTLPTTERPLRLAEFDDLFARSLRGQERATPTRLRWQLEPDIEATARDLTGRETLCCSFFTFTFTAAGTSLWVEVEVPPAHVDVLDALQQRAAAGMAP